MKQKVLIGLSYEVSLNCGQTNGCDFIRALEDKIFFGYNEIRILENYCQNFEGCDSCQDLVEEYFECFQKKIAEAK